MKRLLEKNKLLLEFVLITGVVESFQPCLISRCIHFFFPVSDLPGHFIICFLFSRGDKMPCSRSALQRMCFSARRWNLSESLRYKAAP